jgi:hypothetical protein
MNSKGFSAVLLALIIAAALIAGAVATFIWFESLGGSQLFGDSSGANVLVLGMPSADVIRTLSSEEAAKMRIAYPINLPPNTIWSYETLKNYNVIILQGDPYFDMSTRELIKQYVESGGKLIVVGDAGSKHPMYPNVAGWEWPSDQGIPVPADIVGNYAGYSDISYGSELNWANPNHPIAKGMKLVGSSTSGITQVLKVNSKGGAVIAVIETNEGSTPAIIEGGSGFGNTIYFAYDPGQTPEILLTTIKYLAGV